MSLLPRACGATVALAILALLLPPNVRDAQAQSSDATQLFPQQGFAKASGQDVYQAICRAAICRPAVARKVPATILRFPATPSWPPARTSP